MSTVYATNVQRWQVARPQRTTSRLMLRESVRDSAARTVEVALPRGGHWSLVDKAEISRARKDGGALAKTALLLMEADAEGRTQIMAYLNGVVRAYERDDDVMEAMFAEHEADVDEDRVQAAVFAAPTPENLDRWLPAARKAWAALDRAIAAAERRRMEG